VVLALLALGDLAAVVLALLALGDMAAVVLVEETLWIGM
jgi:hypothetical protein